MSTKRNLAVLLGLMVVLALAAPNALGKKPPKPPPDSPTGTVYYTLDAQPQLYAMDADGSDKLMLPTGVRGEPSHALHGGERWFLYYDTVSGTYPDGTQRREVFAVDESGTSVVQLTDEPLFDKRDGSGHTPWARWTQDANGTVDGLVSWWSMRWESGVLVACGIHAARIAFDANGDVVGLAEAPTLLVQGDVVQLTNLAPEIISYDWKPDGTAIVFDRHDNVGDAGLFVYDLASDTTTPITTYGVGPAWSPDGLRIAFAGGGGISTVKPDGAGLVTIVSALTRRKGWESIYDPEWSPTSTHLVYTRGYYHQNKGGSKDVYRVQADGSDKTDLTDDTEAYATPVSWR